ncbi:MAG TPA: EAL domain-containing protein [Usitatibacter sp.]|jgi:EAL domain-containing protein (putative c-di-GMP-specific phosphodiesterase class I)|nr:EAL domain-containing protein [Usitatibacter sp.]
MTAFDDSAHRTRELAKPLLVSARKAELLRALKDNQLGLAYQPIYRLSTGHMTKIEALLRWRSPVFGQVPPDRFVFWMEELGLIEEVGEWVLERVCAQACTWNRGADRVKVSFNVSPRQLESGRFSHVLKQCLQRTGCNPAWLELELTERCLAQDLYHVRQELSEIRALGLTVAMDDFGSGYSSLNQLAELPVQSIKIDRAMVTGACGDHRRSAIVSAVIRLCGVLGLGVTAEGVETAHDVAYLREFEPIDVQGFFFGRPGPANAVLLL